MNMDARMKLPNHISYTDALIAAKRGCLILSISRGSLLRYAKGEWQYIRNGEWEKMFDGYVSEHGKFRVFHDPRHCDYLKDIRVEPGRCEPDYGPFTLTYTQAYTAAILGATVQVQCAGVEARVRNGEWEFEPMFGHGPWNPQPVMPKKYLRAKWRINTPANQNVAQL